MCEEYHPRDHCKNEISRQAHRSSMNGSVWQWASHIVGLILKSHDLEVTVCELFEASGPESQFQVVGHLFFHCMSNHSGINKRLTKSRLSSKHFPFVAMSSRFAIIRHLQTRDVLI